MNIYEIEHGNGDGDFAFFVLADTEDEAMKLVIKQRYEDDKELENLTVIGTEKWNGEKGILGNYTTNN